MSSLDKAFLNTDTEDQFIKQLMSSVAQVTRSSNSLPKGLDFNYSNSFPQYREKNKQASDKTKELLVNTLNLCRKGFLAPLKLSDDICDSYFYEQIAETLDLLVDHATTSIQQNTPSDQLLSTAKQSLYLNKDRLIQENVKDMVKPQLAFLNEIDNSRQNPFRPKLKVKYHKKENYQFVERPFVSGGSSDVPEGCNFYFPHPYERELLELQYPEWLLSKPSPSQSNPFPDPNRPFLFVSTPAALDQLIEEVKLEKIIALDLEHHSFRSFQGLTCLIQLSTSAKDYIIDPLELRADCERLGAIFADPKITKVLHGCEQDILWLQRDFGLYLVNAFDTFLAAKELQFPALSLAHLVKYYCHIELDKKHQLSDWRQRPLPEEMLKYAKLDTHYLIFIFYSIHANLWNQIGIEGVEKVLFMTRKLCLQRYEKPLFDPLGYKKLFQTSVHSKYIPKFEELNALQESTLSMLWNWRDEHARKEDESYEFIMSSAELLRLGVKIPQSIDQLEACGPLTVYVQSHKLALLKLFLDLTTINPVNYLNHQRNSKQKIENHHHRFLQHERQKFQSLFTAIPKIPDELLSMPKAETNAWLEESLRSLPTLSLEEIFKIAKWESSGSSSSSESYRGEADSAGRLSSLHLNSIDPQRHSTSDSQSKLTKSFEDLTSIIQNEMEFESMLRHLVKEKDQQQAIPANTADVSQKVDIPADTANFDIPKTYEEIYRLSGKNRKKNKEKKRNRETDSSIETETFLSEKDQMMVVDEETEVVENAASKQTETEGDFNVDDYFVTESSASDKVDTSVDATLKFARDIGYLKSEAEMNEIREEHQQVLAEQQSIEDSNEEGKRTTSGTSSLDAHISPNRSRDGKLIKPNPNIPNSVNSSTTAANQSSKLGKSTTLNQSRPKNATQFDYSKVSSATIGALSTGTSTTNSTTSNTNSNQNSSRHRSNNTGRGGGSGGRNSNRGKSNPYFTAHKK
eukprot:gene2464-2620_t